MESMLKMVAIHAMKNNPPKDFLQYILGYNHSVENTEIYCIYFSLFEMSGSLNWYFYKIHFHCNILVYSLMLLSSSYLSKVVDSHLLFIHHNYLRLAPNDPWNIQLKYICFDVCVYVYTYVNVWVEKYEFIWSA